MNDKYNERVEAILARTRLGEALVAVGALSTAVLVAAMPMDASWQCAALAWVGVLSLHAVARLRPGLRLALGHDGIVEVGARKGVLRDGSLVAPWLVVIRWRPDGARLDRTLLVAPQMLPRDDFRRLRVLVRFGDRRTEGTDLQERGANTSCCGRPPLRAE